MARTQTEYLRLRAYACWSEPSPKPSLCPLQRSDSRGSSPEEILLASPLFAEAEAAKEQQSICP